MGKHSGKCKSCLLAFLVNSPNKENVNQKYNTSLSKARILLLEEGRHIEPDIPINLSLEEKISWIIGEADPIIGLAVIALLCYFSGMIDKERIITT